MSSLKVESQVLGIVHRKPEQSVADFQAEAVDFFDIVAAISRDDNISVVQVDVYRNLTLRENKFARYYAAVSANTDICIFDPSDEMRWSTSAVMELVETSDVLEKLFINLSPDKEHHVNVGDVFVIRSRDWGFFCGAFVCEHVGWTRLPGRHIEMVMPNIVE